MRVGGVLLGPKCPELGISAGTKPGTIERGARRFSWRSACHTTSTYGRAGGHTIPHNAGVAGSSPAPAIIGSLAIPSGCGAIFMCFLGLLPCRGSRIGECGT